MVEVEVPVGHCVHFPTDLMHFGMRCMNETPSYRYHIQFNKSNNGCSRVQADENSVNMHTHVLQGQAPENNDCYFGAALRFIMPSASTLTET